MRKFVAIAVASLALLAAAGVAGGWTWDDHAAQASSLGFFDGN